MLKRCYLGQGLSEGDADPSFLNLLLEVFDAILAVIILGSYGAHPSPAEVEHQLGNSCRLVLVVGNGPEEGGELELTFQGGASGRIADLKMTREDTNNILYLFILLVFHRGLPLPRHWPTCGK